MKGLVIFLAGLLCGAALLWYLGFERAAPPAALPDPGLPAPMPTDGPVTHTDFAPAQMEVPRSPHLPLPHEPSDVETSAPDQDISLPEAPTAEAEPAPATTGTVAPAAEPSVAATDATALPAAPVPMPREPKLLLPVAGVKASQLSDTFTDARGQGRSHDAIDIMAPTGTPVFAVEDGTIAKLFDSKPGGLTIYHFDVAKQLAYYYGHLDRYAEGLAEGQAVKRGDVIGYVGYTGNASPEAPHLHFAIFILGPEKQWWKGTPVNPYRYLGGTPR